MINWIKKTTTELGTMAKNAANTPAPIGKTVLITTGVIAVAALIILNNQKAKVIFVFG